METGSIQPGNGMEMLMTKVQPLYFSMNPLLLGAVSCRSKLSSVLK